MERKGDDRKSSEGNTGTGFQNFKKTKVQTSLLASSFKSLISLLSYLHTHKHNISQRVYKGTLES